MAATHSMDFTCGPIMKKMLRFAFPMLLMSLLRQFYHSADLMVVGNFAGDQAHALAAVGACSALSALMVGFCTGFSEGNTIICARLRGEGNFTEIKKAVSTSLYFAVGLGLTLSLIAWFFGRYFLLWMDCPAEILEDAALYLRVTFLAQPFSMVYTVVAGLCRAFGDSKRPLWISMSTGALNVLLNVVFVAGLHWDVLGVALATLFAEIVATGLILYLLFRSEDFSLEVKDLIFYPNRLWEQVRIGLPCGLNTALFSFSNVLVLSQVNSFGAAAVAANSTSTSVSSYLSLLACTYGMACVSFVGQNHGAKNYERIEKMVKTSIPIFTAVVLAAAIFVTWRSDLLLLLFTSDPDVLYFAGQKLMLLTWGHVINVTGEILMGCLRGFGKTAQTTTINLVCVCSIRVLWTYFALAVHPYFWFLFVCYPISYGISSIISVFYFRRELKKAKSQLSTVPV